MCMCIEVRKYECTVYKTQQYGNAQVCIKNKRSSLLKFIVEYRLNRIPKLPSSGGKSMQSRLKIGPIFFFSQCGFNNVFGFKFNVDVDNRICFDLGVKVLELFKFKGLRAGGFNSSLVYQCVVL